jgi:co-chaperonin GroES (HSP10)
MTTPNKTIAFTPLKDRVVVREHKATETISTGGLYIPAQANKKTSDTRGEVLAVGADVKNVAVGDVVIFSRVGSGWDVVIDGQDCTVLKEVDLLGKVVAE